VRRALETFYAVRLKQPAITYRMKATTTGKTSATAAINTVHLHIR
jgi:hypothetical protein